MMNFDPFAQLSKGLEMMQKMQEQSMALTKESLAYGAELNAEWRKLTMEALTSATAAFVVKPAA